MTELTPQDMNKIVNGTHCDPFSVLGLHQRNGEWTVTAFVPGAVSIEVLDSETDRKIASLAAIDGLFTGVITGCKAVFPYRLRVSTNDHTWTADDPYRFGPVMGELDEHLLSEGTHRRLWDVLGAHVMTHENIGRHPFRDLGAQRKSGVGCR